mgnify:CR=1 FL=1
MLPILIALLLISPVAAISVSYQITPEIVLPGGYADCTIRISNPSPSEVEVYSISFFSSDVEVLPSSVSIGKIAPQSSYAFNVSMKSQIVGRHVVEAQVSLENGSLTLPIALVVDDKFPMIAIVSPLYSGEVKKAELVISSPVLLQDVKIEALFNATPKVQHIGTLSGVAKAEFKFSEELKELPFSISFYNGKSYHEVRKSLKVDYLESKGLATNLRLSKDVLFTGEAVKLTLEIANLRNDEVYLVEVKALGNGKFSQDIAKIEKLIPGERKSIEFVFSPRESGEVELRISYQDYFGVKHEVVERASIELLEAKALQITNLRTERTLEKTRISGEIVNYGHSDALSVSVSAQCEGSRAEQFVGKVDPNDYETFDLETSCKNATLELSWWNDAGERFTIIESIEFPSFETKEPMKTSVPLMVSIGASVPVIALILYIFLRHRKK